MVQGYFKEVTEAFAYQIWNQRRLCLFQERLILVFRKKHSLLNCSRCWKVYSMFNNLCHGKALVSTKHSATLHARKNEIKKWGEDHREDAALETGGEACCQGGLGEERPEWPLRTNPIRWSKIREGQSCWEAFLQVSLESQTDLAMKEL